LQELVHARGPSGQEDEVRDICVRELGKWCDDVWTDEAGNVIGKRDSKGSTGTNISSATQIMAHMDEIAMLVKRVNADGGLRVKGLGSIKPGYIGQGPVEVLADSRIIPGVLSLGPTHTSSETPHVHKTRTQPIEWQDVHVFTGYTAEELIQHGVHPGTRVVIARHRREIFEVQNYLGGYFFDDRAGIASLVGVAALLHESGKNLQQDVYFTMTVQEELNVSGAACAARLVPSKVVIAIDVGPVADEYGISLNSEPIIVYGDEFGVYAKSVADKLLFAARNAGIQTQSAVWERYRSDASGASMYGVAPCNGLICIPTSNTHGFEIIHPDGIIQCAKLIVSYLTYQQEDLGI
jgi:putative aminopeptidase FrvX